MKKYKFFGIFTCMCCMFLLTSCDKQGIHKPLASGEYEQILLPRGDCMLCPDADECCCSVSLQPGQSSASIVICGSTNSIIGSCPIREVGICEASNGISYTPTLTPQTPSAPFCSLVDGPLCIENFGSVTALIIISCQVGVLNPDTVWLQIPAFTTVCFQTDDECVLGPCE